MVCKNTWVTVALMACLLVVGFAGTTLLLAQDKEPEKTAPPRVDRPGPAGEGPAAERAIKIVALRHQPAQAAARTLHELQPPRGRNETREAVAPALIIVVNEPANAIVLAGPPEVVERLTDVLMQLDEMTAARIQTEKERRRDQAARDRDMPLPEFHNRQRGEMPGYFGPPQGRLPGRMGPGQWPQNPMMNRQGPRGGQVMPQGPHGKRPFRGPEAMPWMGQRGHAPPFDRPEDRDRDRDRTERRKAAPEEVPE